MTDPALVTARWGRTIVDTLVEAGVDAACLAPGSRSTPLTLAFVAHEDVTCTTHLDERSAAYFALGRAKRTGTPTAVVCTSGTAAANLHPAVIEANQSRTPLVVCTADRPPELHDSGANQTIDQLDLYGDTVRFSRSLPEPEAAARKVRSLRVAVARAVAASQGTPAGPVHLNVPLRKPLEPPVDAAPVAAFDETTLPGSELPDGRSVATTQGTVTLSSGDLEALSASVEAAERGLIVAGPADPCHRGASTAITELAATTGFPVLADPLSGLRFGEHLASVTVCGGYDAYLDAADELGWPVPDLVLRFGAAPTSAALADYLAAADARQYLVDPAGGWREATFTATDLVTADPEWLAAALTRQVDGSVDDTWVDRFQTAERAHWEAVAAEDRFFEGAVLAATVAGAPEPATLVVGNSMPVRDLDRFGRPGPTDLTVLGNRGASGIDGVTSTALGAASATDDPLVLVTGDLSYYHDMNGLLALDRAGVEATIVVIDNDGGGIFHMLPIAEHEAFEDWFVTPHGLDLGPTADLYDLSFSRVETLEAFGDRYAASLESDGTQVIAVDSDAAASFAVREDLRAAVLEELTG